jgi:excisionase family DNA binding protein
MSTTIKTDIVYTLEEAAMLLKVQPVTVRRLVLRKKLPRVPFIRHIRIPARELHTLAGIRP